MVGDRHVGPAEGSRGLDHLRQGQPAIAERGVYLEIGARGRFPPWVRVERSPDLRVREEPAPSLLGFGHGRRIVEPSVDLRADPRPDGPELRE